MRSRSVSTQENQFSIELSSDLKEEDTAAAALIALAGSEEEDEEEAAEEAEDVEDVEDEVRASRDPS